MEPRLLALDTATDRSSIALLRGDGGAALLREWAGGARASSALIPGVLTLLDEAGLRPADLDGVAFGRGPGAFTGLRAACSVAQGFAYGVRRPVVAVDSLLLVADDAFLQQPADDWWVAMDARMDEIYAARYRRDGARWLTVAAPALYTLPSLVARWQAEPPAAVAGSAIEAFGERLPAGGAIRIAQERSRAAALARLARQAWQDGPRLPAAEARPLYLRDRVALTTDEQQALRAGRRQAKAPA